MDSPTPRQIRKARREAGLSQRRAALTVHCGVRTWQQWEYAGNNPRMRRAMHPAVWELFQIKVKNDEKR